MDIDTRTRRPNPEDEPLRRDRLDCPTERERAQFERYAWDKIVDATSTLPIERGEGYYQVLQRMCPSLSPDQLLREAHRIKHLSHDRDILYVGERLPMASREERCRMLDAVMREFDRQTCGPTDPWNRQPGPPRRPPAGGPDGDRQNPYDRYGDPDRPPSRPPGQRPPTPGTSNPYDRYGDPDRLPSRPSDEPPILVPYEPPRLPPAEPPRQAPPDLSVDPLGPLLNPPTDSGNPPGRPPVIPPDGRPPVTNPGDGQPPSGPGHANNPLFEAATKLQEQHDQALQRLNDEESRQGFIGRAFDGAKNHIGSSAEGRSSLDPRALWSHVFDSDLGSNALRTKLLEEQTKLKELSEAATNRDQQRFNSIYKEVTGKDYDPKAAATGPLGQSSEKVAQYEQSQRTGVDTITDVSAAVASVLTIRAGGAVKAFLPSIAKGAIAGGASKTLLMQADGAYGDIPRDLAMGALWGGTVPIGEIAGASVSKYIGARVGLTVTGDLLAAQIDTTGASLGTRVLSAAAKSGTSGGVFGAIEAPGSDIIQSLKDGRKISGAELLERSITGATLGFAGGTVLGVALDAIGGGGFRSKQPIAAARRGTGPVDTDEAAKLLGMSPAVFKAKTFADPHGAVQDAISLYEKEGLNLRKFDPATGKPVLPEKFHDALTTTQNVDVLTSGSQLGLRQKAAVVRKTDEFLEQNCERLEDSITRLKADTNYRDVVRNKVATEGREAADKFEQSFEDAFKKDLKTGMSVDQINTPSMDANASFLLNKQKTEAAYLQKAADFFKDMTDPAQRARLNTLTDDIFAKFHPETITRAQINDMLQAVPEKDRALAVALMQESAPNGSDAVLRGRLQAVRSELKQHDIDLNSNNVYTLSPSSSGNLLGYLFRKSNSTSMSIQNIDALAARVAKGDVPKSVVLFDDLSTTPITESQQKALAQIPKVKVVDLGAFEKGINVLDVAQGPAAVAAKLETLLAEARVVANQNPQLLPTGVAREVLSGSVDESAKRLGGNVFVVRPPNNLHIPNAPTAETLAGMEPADSIYAQMMVPKATKENIAAFLSKYAGEERELAAKMLAQGATSNTYGVMLKKAADVHAQISEVLKAQGLTSRDLLFVSDKDPGGSTHMVSYLYRQAAGLSPDNFVSSRGLQTLINEGKSPKYAVGYLDDTIYSGQQAADMLENNYQQLSKFNRVFVGSLGAYQKGLDQIGQTALAKTGKVTTSSAAMHQPFYSDLHPFYGQLGSSARYQVKNLGGASGFGQVQGSLIWSHMYPDNNLEFFGNRFAGGVLRLPGP